LAATEKATASEEPDDRAAPVAVEKPSVSESSQQGGSDEGVIREAHCDAAAGAIVKFAILGDTLLLAVQDLTKIQYRMGGKDLTLGANPCSGWNNRKARITYGPAENKKFQGEITAIEFQ
jgi:endonuclease YncB( thermonuclease family)